MSRVPDPMRPASATRLPLPFGGAYGWLADLTVARKVSTAKATFSKTATVIESYYVAEPNQGAAMRAVRVHAGAGKDAELVLKRTLSRKEVAGLGLRPGQVKAA